jgi:hypothetical protein
MILLVLFSKEGGVFIFKGGTTVYAYSDAAAGTHLEVARAVDKALEVAI